MGLLSRLIWRLRGSPGAEPPPDREPGDGERPKAPQPTATMRPFERPEPTPTAKPRAGGTGTTGGTRTHRTPGGTPSTERIHNPTRHGR